MPFNPFSIFSKFMRSPGGRRTAMLGSAGAAGATVPGAVEGAIEKHDAGVYQEGATSGFTQGIDAGYQQGVQVGAEMGARRAAEEMMAALNEGLKDAESESAAFEAGQSYGMPSIPGMPIPGQLPGAGDGGMGMTRTACANGYNDEIAKLAGPYPISRALMGVPVGAALGAGAVGGAAALGASSAGGEPSIPADEPGLALAALGTGAALGGLGGALGTRLGRTILERALRGRLRAGNAYKMEAAPLGLTSDIPLAALRRRGGEDVSRFLTNPATQAISGALGSGPVGAVVNPASGTATRAMFSRAMADEAAEGVGRGAGLVSDITAANRPFAKAAASMYEAMTKRAKGEAEGFSQQKPPSPTKPTAAGQVKVPAAAQVSVPQAIMNTKMASVLAAIPIGFEATFPLDKHATAEQVVLDILDPIRNRSVRPLVKIAYGVHDEGFTDPRLIRAANSLISELAS